MLWRISFRMGCAVHSTTRPGRQVWCRTPAAHCSVRAYAHPPIPTVYHELYSAPQLGPRHRFPMQVFGNIYLRLLQQGVIAPAQVHRPGHLPTDAELAIVHAPEYLQAFSSLQLDQERVRR
jgi:hypothetical protein